jgi:hypothetical protein
MVLSSSPDIALIILEYSDGFVEGRKRVLRQERWMEKLYRIYRMILIP